MNLVLEATAFAARRHRDQRRKGADAAPYINHPLEVARTLAREGGVTDPAILAAALLHDTIEDTGTTYEDLRGLFGARVANLVVELTDVKFLGKHTRKVLQRARAGRASAGARQIKIADKICNLRDILASPPADWSEARRREYFEWVESVVAEARGVNRRLERAFDGVYKGRSAARNALRFTHAKRGRLSPAAPCRPRKSPIAAY